MTRYFNFENSDGVTILIPFSTNLVITCEAVTKDENGIPSYMFTFITPSTGRTLAVAEDSESLRKQLHHFKMWLSKS